MHPSFERLTSLSRCSNSFRTNPEGDSVEAGFLVEVSAGRPLELGRIRQGRVTLRTQSITQVGHSAHAVPHWSETEGLQQCGVRGHLVQVTSGAGCACRPATGP